MIQQRLILVLICLFQINVTWGQKYSNEFLAIGVSARALGMANTQSAIVDDATAGYWNPAGLLDIQDKYAFSLMHASYFNGTANFDFAGFATPVDEISHIGVSLIRFGIDDIPDTRFLFDADGRLNYDNVRSFSAADYALLFSYARRFPLLQNFKFGANFKIIHRNVGIFANAWGFGLDVGAQTTIANKWKIGLAARDITGTYNTWTINSETLEDVFLQTGNTIPGNRIEVTIPRILGDVARSFPIIKDADRIPISSLLVSAGLDLTFDGQRNTLIRTEFASIDPRIGFEFDYRNIVFVRSGIGNFQRIKDFDGSFSSSFQPNFGLGFRINKLFIDYALTDIGNVDQIESSYSHVFSIKLFMGKSFNTKPRTDYDRE